MRLTLAAMESAESLETDAIIEAMEQTKIETITGELSIRPEDHQGTMGTYIVEAVKLPEPKYGATVAWDVIKPLPWDAVKVPLSETGCPGL